MWAFLARATCSVVVLVGLSREQPAASRIGPQPLDVQMAAHTPPQPSIPEAVLEPEQNIAYRVDPIHRICRVTAYCDRGLTAAGVPSGVGQCAAPADIPFGSRVYIPTLGRTFIVTDRTARRFRHNTVDLFIPDRGKCKIFGRRYIECEITIPRDAVRYGSSRLHALVTASR
jgi:3D (Asp-Asp-Asp) domain-containing protein